MNKKLTTILLAVLIILIGKVDAATLTQKIGEGYIRSTVVEGQQVTIKFVSNKYTFSNWTVESENVSIDTTNPTVTFTMPSSNVVIKANYEGETVYNCACSECTNTVSASGLWCDSCTTAGICSGCSKCVTHNTVLCTICNLCNTCCTCTKYTLTYNANSGSGAPASETGATLIISSTTPTRSGWDFAGWGTSSSATSATYQAGDSITLTADTTLYAVWNKTLTLTYDANGGGGAPSSQTKTTTSTSATFTIRTTEPTPPSGKAFRGWSTSSSDTTADYKIGANITISSNKTLYAVYVTPLSSGTSFTGSDVGAYVTYTPSSTSYTVSTSESGYDSDQTYNPSSMTKWRVFSNDGTNVEIISDESVSGLYLQGSTGYVNAVRTLQDMAAAYVNSSYATSARSFGYSEEGLTEEEIENYKIIDTTTYPLEYGIDNDIFPYTDSQYEKDTLIVSFVGNHSLMQKWNTVWVASRRTSDSALGLRYFTNEMREGARFLANIKSDGTISATSQWGTVRPIVTLKSSLTVASGDGSPSNPYVLLSD